MSEPRKRCPSRSSEYVTVVGDVAYVQLTRGAVSVIDAADAADVGERLWHLDSDGYASRASMSGGKLVRLPLHRFFLTPPSGMQVDHINGDRLDNRRANLRICSTSENQQNKKPISKYGGVGVLCHYKGVSVFRGKYQVQIKAGKVRKYVGRFSTALEAALAYDKAALEMHGDFARTNFRGGRP